MFSPATVTAIRSIIDETGDEVVGVLGPDGLTISMESVSGANDLDEIVSTLGSASELFFGPYPARDNDGVGAITLVVPDSDGVVRDHPH